MGGTAYWRNANARICHVAVVSWVSGGQFGAIGAHGGGPACINEAEGRKRGAKVCERTFTIAKAAGFRGWPGQEHPLLALVQDPEEQHVGTNHDGANDEEWV